LDRAKFREFFAADVNRKNAKFMADSQAPLGLPAVVAEFKTAAWETKPRFYIVAGADRMIPPTDERNFALKATKAQKSHQFGIKGASHALFISQPEKVAKVIEKAARAK
jgi:pimeloyl-ACP methyl ester carboxylesterase